MGNVLGRRPESIAEEFGEVRLVITEIQFETVQTFQNIVFHSYAAPFGSTTVRGYYPGRRFCSGPLG